MMKEAKKNAIVVPISGMALIVLGFVLQAVALFC